MDGSDEWIHGWMQSLIIQPKCKDRCGSIWLSLISLIFQWYERDGLWLGGKKKRPFSVKYTFNYVVYGDIEGLAVDSCSKYVIGRRRSSLFYLRGIKYSSFFVTSCIDRTIEEIWIHSMSLPLQSNSGPLYHSGEHPTSTANVELGNGIDSAMRVYQSQLRKLLPKRSCQVYS